MPLRDESVISTSVLNSIYKELADHRDVVRRGLSENGIDVAELQDVRRFISLRRYVRTFEWLAKALGDSALGLKLSQRAGPDALGAVGYLFLSSGTLETKLGSLQRYLEAIQSTSIVDMIYTDDFVQVRYGIDDESISPRGQDSEYSIGLMWHYMRLLSKNQCRLTQVTFEHDRPFGSDTIYRRVFDAPVIFGQRINELTLPVSEMRHWYEGLDPHLIPILEDHISSTIRSTENPGTFRDVVARELTDLVLRQGARADLVAARLGISVATLHRRLRNEGCRFKHLVTARSMEVSKRLLRDTNVSIAEISTRLGYRDPAIFSRAVRRWFGTTPRDFRHSLRQK